MHSKMIKVEKVAPFRPQPSQLLRYLPQPSSTACAVLSFKDTFLLFQLMHLLLQGKLKLLYFLLLPHELSEVGPVEQFFFRLQLLDQLRVELLQLLPSESLPCALHLC